MSGTANVLSGFIELTVSPVQQQLNPITIKNYPLSISFAPRSTPPTLDGNKIIESTDNSTNDCTYRGNKYKLVNIQFCSVMNKRFLLPGQGNPPVAELIISFYCTSTDPSIKKMDGILLCVPIYDSGTPNHNEYLTQLIDRNMPKCKYTQNEGVSYTAGEYKSITNSNLMNCVKSCCGEPNCISYTFNSGKCSLNNIVSDLQTSDASITSGTINRSGDGENTVAYKSLSPTLETIFYNSDVDTSQTSLAYITTFNTVDSKNAISSTRKLYVVVFPNGIRMTSSTYQQLLLQMRSMNPSITQNLLPYYVPPVIRNFEDTLVSYDFDSYGNKIPKRTSNKGEISQNTLSSCNDEFRNRVEYFIKPPYIISKSTKSFNSEKCPYYKTNEYKCVPFNQLHDLSGVDQDAYVIPGNSTLQSILDKNKSTSGSSTSVSTATDDIIVYSTIAVCGIAVAVVLYKIGMEIYDS